MARPSGSPVATSSGSTRRGSPGRSRRSPTKTSVGPPGPFSTRPDTPAPSPASPRLVPDNPRDEVLASDRLIVTDFGAAKTQAGTDCVKVAGMGSQKPSVPGIVAIVRANRNGPFAGAWQSSDVLRDRIRGQNLRGIWAADLTLIYWPSLGYNSLGASDVSLVPVARQVNGKLACSVASRCDSSASSPREKLSLLQYQAIQMSSNKSIYSIVVLGTMNPRIHSPAWYRLVGLISEEEMQEANQNELLIDPMVAKWQLKDLTMLCQFERWELQTFRLHE